MGLSFNNVHVCLKEELSEETGRRIAEILLRGMKATQVSDASEADISISMYREKDSPWLTIVSDVMEEDLDRQLRITKELSGELDTNVLAIACFDSDYLACTQTETFGHLQVTLIPTKNYAGQCGVVLPHAAEFHARMTAD